MKVIFFVKLLTDREVPNIRKAFTNNSSADTKLSKIQLSKMIPLGGFLSRLLDPLLKTGFPLIKNVIKSSAKSVLIPLRLTAAASAADAGIHKKDIRIRNNNFENFKWRNEWYNENCSSTWNSNILLNGVTKTVQNEVKEQKGGFLSILLGTLAASLLGNLLTGKGIYRAGKGKGINTAGEGIVRAAYGRPSSSALHNNKTGFLILPHPLTNFEIQKMVFFHKIICKK